MINSLQSLRGIFIVMIFLHHYQVDGQPLFEAGGRCGVDFFLILSGFVMCAGYGKKVSENKLKYKVFIIKRLIRIYPLHLLCLSTWIFLRLIYKQSIGWINLIPNVFLIQSWFPEEKVYFSGNAVCWCLSDLLFFYSVFPLILRFIGNHKKISFYTLILSVVTYFAIINLIPASLQQSLIYINPLFRLIDFSIGIILWQVCLLIEDSRTIRNIQHLGKLSKTFIEILPFCLYVLLICNYSKIPGIYSLTSYWWIPTVITIFIFTVFSKNGGYITELLRIPFLVKFGNTSFTFYMIHTLGICIIPAFINKLGLGYSWISNLIIIFIVLTFISVCINRYYELPVSRYLSSKLHINKTK